MGGERGISLVFFFLYLHYSLPISFSLFFEFPYLSAHRILIFVFIFLYFFCELPLCLFILFSVIPFFPSPLYSEFRIRLLILLYVSSSSSFPLLYTMSFQISCSFSFLPLFFSLPFPLFSEFLIYFFIPLSFKSVS